MTRPPAILQVIDSLRTGGAEWMLAGLVGELEAADLARVVVVAATSDRADPALVEMLRERACGLVLLEARRLADRRFLGGVVQVARRHRAVLLHSHLVGANVNARVAARLLGRRQVATIHTPPGGAEDSRARLRADGLTARLSDRLVAPGDAVADAYAAHWRVPRSRFTVIPSAPPPRPPSPGLNRVALRSELGAGPDDLLVLCVARLEPAKGVDVLLEAVDGLAGVRVAVAGDGPQRPSLRPPANAVLLGRREDVGDLLAAADVFCLASRHEALPMSVLEAMAAGVPVVATAVGELPALLGGEAGILVPPGDPAALRAALTRSRDAPAAGRGELGRRRVGDRHGGSVVALRHAELYEEVLSGSGGRSS